MKNGRMQCKDIPDEPVLRFLHGLGRWGTWFWTDDYKPDNSVLNVMPEGTPEYLGLAKMRMLMRRGLVDGCDCGCRGDFELTDKGREAIGVAPVAKAPPRQRGASNDLRWHVAQALRGWRL